MKNRIIRAVYFFAPIALAGLSASESYSILRTSTGPAGDTLLVAAAIACVFRLILDTLPPKELIAYGALARQSSLFAAVLLATTGLSHPTSAHVVAAVPAFLLAVLDTRQFPRSKAADVPSDPPDDTAP